MEWKGVWPRGFSLVGPEQMITPRDDLDKPEIGKALTFNST